MQNDYLFAQVGFRFHEEGYITLDPVEVFSKLPQWASFTAEMSKTCLDSIPTLTTVAAHKGFLEEKDFEDVGLWQTADEQKEEEKHPRDTLPLYRQRAIILTTKGAKARIEARKQEIEEKQRKEKEKKERDKDRETYHKRVKLAWESLRRDVESGLTVQPKRKWKDDTQCIHCREWFGAWQGC
jgi:hypothetical protein